MVASINPADLIERWPMMPGPKWQTPLQGRTWLGEQRQLLGWSHKEVEKAFSACAYKSDLYIGPGGEDLFDRPTEKRVARFEREGQVIPDWLYWIPLAIRYAEVSGEKRYMWERDNIPGNSDVRREKEEADNDARTYYLNDDEIALIERFRTLNAGERAAVLRAFAATD